MFHRILQLERFQGFLESIMGVPKGFRRTQMRSRSIQGVSRALQRFSLAFRAASGAFHEAF